MRTGRDRGGRRAWDSSRGTQSSSDLLRAERMRGSLDCLREAGRQGRGAGYGHRDGRADRGTGRGGPAEQGEDDIAKDLGVSGIGADQGAAGGTPPGSAARSARARAGAPRLSPTAKGGMPPSSRREMLQLTGKQLGDLGGQPLVQQPGDEATPPGSRGQLRAEGRRGGRPRDGRGVLSRTS